MRVNFEMDMRDVLPAVQAPALVLHRAHDHWTATEEAQLIADSLKTAQLVILPWYGNQGDIMSEIEEFSMGKRQASQTGRVLTTLMLTDIVNSTGISKRMATKTGCLCWRSLVIAPVVGWKHWAESFTGTTATVMLFRFRSPVARLNAHKPCGAMRRHLVLT